MKFLCFAYGDPRTMEALGEHLGWAVEVWPIGGACHQ